MRSENKLKIVEVDEKTKIWNRYKQIHILPRTPNGKETRTTETAQNKNRKSEKPRGQLFPSRWPPGYPKKKEHKDKHKADEH